MSYTGARQSFPSPPKDNTPTRGGYRTVILTFAMNGRVEGDYDDMIRALNRLEGDHIGLRQYGTDWTKGYPIVTVKETP